MAKIKIKKILFLAPVLGIIFFLTGVIDSRAASCTQAGPCQGKNQNDDCVATGNKPGSCVVVTDDETNTVTGCWCWPKATASGTAVSSCLSQPEGTACTDAAAGISGACQGGTCSAINNPGASLGNGTPASGAAVTGSPVSGPAPGKGIEIPTDTGLPDPQGGIAQIVRNLLTWLLGIVGMIAIIGFVISGVQYLTSAGDEDRMQSAKRNMLYAIIGVVVVLSSFVIIKAIQYALEARPMF